MLVVRWRPKAGVAIPMIGAAPLLTLAPRKRDTEGIARQPNEVSHERQNIFGISPI